MRREHRICCVLLVVALAGACVRSRALAPRPARTTATSATASALPLAPSVPAPATLAVTLSPAAAVAPQKSTKHTGCKLRGALPDPECTPGAVMAGITVDVVCHQSTRERRHVEPSVHREAFAEYGFTFPQPRGAFEVDHLIPLELGGDNTIENLWAQPASPRPGFHEKDHVEDYLHRRVCSGVMTLEEAQRVIAADWLSVWRRMGGIGTGDNVEEE
jgi:hypothetical protein